MVAYAPLTKTHVPLSFSHTRHYATIAKANPEIYCRRSLIQPNLGERRVPVVQVCYKKLSATVLPVNLFKKALAIAVIIPILSTSSVVITHVTMVDFKVMQVIPYIFLEILTYILGGYWYLLCESLSVCASVLAEDFQRALRHIGPAGKVAEYRALWLRLSKLARNTGIANCYTFTFVNLYLFLIITLSIYGLLSQISQGFGIKDIGLAVTACCSIFLLFFICDEAHYASQNVRTNFQKKLLMVELSWMNTDAQTEVNMFLRATEMNPSQISLGGFFDVNRNLFKSISDDEDETHPNIDTPSLFRWRHQARVERMEARKREKEEHEQRKAEVIRRLAETKQKIATVEPNSSDLESLKKALAELEKEEQEMQKKEDELRKKEKKTPWNVDTISEPGFTKTIINTKALRPKEENLTEEEKEARMRKFINDNEKLLKQFGMLRKYDDSKQFLQQHSQLVCEETANYLVIWCINLEMEEKHDLMQHVAHQTICMQYILELSKQLDVDPRACVGSFFSRIQIAEKTYKDSFDDELEQFKARIKKRAAEKIQEAIREQEEEERKARLGPGGLDPVEVYEELPDELKKCFDAQDVPMLQATIAKMPEQEAIYYMKRCVDSGLWVPGKNDEEPTMKENVTPEQKKDTPSVSTDDLD